MKNTNLKVSYVRDQNKKIESLLLGPLLGSIILILISVSNFFYGTEYSFNHQLLVPTMVFLMIVMVVSMGGRLTYVSILLMALIVIFGLSDAILSGRLIALYHMLIALVFSMAVPCSMSFYGSPVSKLWPVPVSIGVFLSLGYAADFGINFNKNWLAMTSFYLLALSNKENKKVPLLFLIIACFLIESRGALVVCVVALILLVLGGRKYIRFVCISGLVLLIVIAMMFLHFYLNNLWLYEYIYQDGRGLGGRDVALLLGYKELMDSYFLGQGLGFNGNFSDSILGSSREDVYVHFGVLDLLMKVSLIGVVILILIIIKSLRSAPVNVFPFLFAGLISIFFYNGLGLSHFGLNFFLYILLGLGLSTANCKFDSSVCKAF